jgi:ABC-type amino acid transport substrate-binding protein
MTTTRRDVLALMAASLFLPPLAAGADLTEIKTRGVLRVLAVLQTPTPEFFSVDPKQPPGFDREILDGFGKAHGLKVEFIPVPSWDLLVPALLEGKGDMIAGRVSHTPTRAKAIDFTAEVFPTRDIVFNFAPRPPIATREQLLALPKVGTLRGSSMAESLRAAGYPVERTVYPAVPETMPDLVGSGELAAGVWVLEAAMVWQQTHKDLQIGLPLGEPQSLAYGVPKGTPLLLAALNDHIRLVKQSGTWNRLTVKYFGAQAPDILKRARTAG